MSARNETGQTAKSAPNTGTATPPVSVLVVDDHHVVRVGLCIILHDHPQLRVVGEASTAAEAIVDPLVVRQMFSLVALGLPAGRLVNSSLGLTDRDHRMLAMVHGGVATRKLGRRWVCRRKPCVTC